MKKKEGFWTVFWFVVAVVSLYFFIRYTNIATEIAMRGLESTNHGLEFMADAKRMALEMFLVSIGSFVVFLYRILTALGGCRK